MKSATILFVALLVAVGVSDARGQSAVYTPLGAWADAARAAFQNWELKLSTGLSAPLRPDISSASPLLPGLRSKNLELLQDALQRKYTTRVKTDAVARKHIIRLSSNRAGMNVLNGTMAESLFWDLNRAEGWEYVRKPNAPQHDFTRPRPGGGRENLQVKFHGDGSPTRYAADMKKDSRAHKFAVPDDHVEPLKAYLRQEYYRLKAIGDFERADEAVRNFGRVRGIGATADEITLAVKESARCSAREQYAVYMPLGASLALAFGPTIWDWANGNMASNQACYWIMRGASLLGVGVGTDVLLETIRQGSLRGTLRGNAIVGTALAITEMTWLLYEHGGSKALGDAQFYESVGGSLGGLVLGPVAFGAAIVWIPGPGWVVGGGAFLASGVAGVVGYVGGRGATHMILEIMEPDMLQQRQRERLNETKRIIEERIAEARVWPPVPAATAR